MKKSFAAVAPADTAGASMVNPSDITRNIDSNLREILNRLLIDASNLTEEMDNIFQVRVMIWKTVPHFTINYHKKQRYHIASVDSWLNSNWAYLIEVEIPVQKVPELVPEGGNLVEIRSYFNESPAMLWY